MARRCCRFIGPGGLGFARQRAFQDNPCGRSLGRRWPGFARSLDRGRGEAALAQRIQRLHRRTVLTLDPGAVAQQRAQRLEGRHLCGLGFGRVGQPAGGEQVGQHQRLQPVGALLAPPAADGGLGRRTLVRVARRPGGQPDRRVALELGRVLVGQEEKGPAGQAVADSR